MDLGDPILSALSFVTVPDGETPKSNLIRILLPILTTSAHLKLLYEHRPANFIPLRIHTTVPCKMRRVQKSDIPS